MAGALWVTTAGTVCASWAGGAPAVTPLWKPPAVMSRTTMEVKSQMPSDTDQTPTRTLNQTRFDNKIHPLWAREIFCTCFKLSMLCYPFYVGHSNFIYIEPIAVEIVLRCCTDFTALNPRSQPAFNWKKGKKKVKIKRK